MTIRLDVNFKIHENLNKLLIYPIKFILYGVSHLSISCRISQVSRNQTDFFFFFTVHYFSKIPSEDNTLLFTSFTLNYHILVTCMIPMRRTFCCLVSIFYFIISYIQQYILMSSIIYWVTEQGILRFM